MGINTAYIKGYSDDIIGIINSILVPLLVAFAFVVFLYGIYKYFIKGAANEKERETGRTFALYGVIGFVIIFSLWAFVNILMGTLRLGGQVAPNPPTIGTGASAPARQQGGANVSPRTGIGGIFAPGGSGNTLPDSSYGCTDSSASNYSPNATVNDGSCRYASNAGTNANTTAATSCDYGTVDGTACRAGNGETGVCYSGSCIAERNDDDWDGSMGNTSSQANINTTAPTGTQNSSGSTAGLLGSSCSPGIVADTCGIGLVCDPNTRKCTTTSSSGQSSSYTTAGGGETTFQSRISGRFTGESVRDYQDCMNWLQKHPPVSQEDIQNCESVLVPMQ